MPTALAGVVLLLAGCGTAGTATSTSAATRHTSGTARHTTATPGHGTSTTTARSGRIPTCALSELPDQATDTAEAIVSGGPFAHPRNDGVVYQNRSKVLPQRARGVYREFTVKTPGSKTRGTRRIVTDGNPKSGAPTTSPSAWYYTGDHYNTFCAITGTP